MHVHTWVRMTLGTRALFPTHECSQQQDEGLGDMVHDSAVSLQPFKPSGERKHSTLEPEVWNLESGFR